MRIELKNGQWAEVDQATVRTWRAQQRSDAVLTDQTDVMLDLAQRCITSWSYGEVTLDALENLALGDFNKIMNVVNGDDSPLDNSPAPETATALTPGNGDSDSSAKPDSPRRSAKL